jgi:hypothetical protein
MQAEVPDMVSTNTITVYPWANGAERRSGRKPGARVLIPPGYLHPGKGTH